MKIVIDTNIIFSALINSSGLIGDVIFNSQDQFEFFAPDFLVDELTK